MNQQDTMHELLCEVDADLHRARAVAPSKIVPCDSKGCQNIAWVGEDDKRPWLCWYCQQENT